WKEEAVPEHDLPFDPEDSAPNLKAGLVLLCEQPDLSASRIQAQMTSGGHYRELKVLSWHSSHLRRGLRFQDLVVQLIQELRDLWQSRPARETASTSLLGKEPAPLLVQVVVAETEEPFLLSALAGVLKVAQQE